MKINPQPVIASYCTTFLKQEMAHVYRQISGLRAFRTFVMTKSRQNSERYPFADVEMIGDPKMPMLRRFYLKYIQRQEPIFYRGEFDVLQKILHRRDAKLMHIYFGHTGVHLLPFIKVWDKPCVVSFHGVDISPREHQAGYKAKLAELVQTVPLVLARSNSLRDRLIQFGCPADRVVLNRTGIPLDQFPVVERTAPQDGKWILLQACRLIPKKGLITALYAFKDFLKVYPNAQFQIAGEGPLRRKLKSLISKLGIDNNVELRGFLNQGNLYKEYRKAHIFLHPSEVTSDLDQEGVPNSMLEAMATGLPVAATHHGGIPEAVTDGAEGFLVPERNPKALCEALCKIVESETTWKALSEQAIQTVSSHFEQRAQIRALEDHYRRVLGIEPLTSVPKINARLATA